VIPVSGDEMKMRYSNDKGQIDIEVRMHDGVNPEGTAYGSILRKPTFTDENLERAVVSVGGQTLKLNDPWGYAHVYVTAFPRDMDEQGYG
jgi:hypothetical protein